ncbi:hypothetical protein E3E27_09895 [Thermococcus sp. MV11]|nr:hypothetical protein [Thermococcus sp. MV11]
MLVIKARGTVPVRVTPEHMVWVVKRIRHKSHYSDGRQVIWWEFKGPEWITAQELKELVERNDDEKVSYMLLQPVPQPTIDVDKIPLRKPVYISNQFGKTRKLHFSSRRTPEFLPLNFETARLLGLWIAEGSTSKTGAIKFDIGSHEEEITKFLIETIRKYFPYANVVVEDHERNRRTVRFCNKRFAEWLRENIGHRAHEKKIPDVLLFNKNREVRLGLLRGLIEGDGYIRRDNYKRANYVTYTTVSPTLAYQLQLLLGSLGHVSSISRSVRKPGLGKSRKPIYEVKISGRSYYELLKELDLEVPPKGNRTYNVNMIWDSYILLKVRSVEEEYYEGDVYNLEVEDDESYSVGFIVHNSAGVNLPSFRVIIRDTKRYSNFGWVDIPVLEIQQMMGRAGRPRYDKFGEAIIVARTEEPGKLMERYIRGRPEKLFSMLANERAFRSQVLALITNFGIKSFAGLVRFLEKTFYAHQRKDLSSLEYKAKEVVYFLIENEFVDLDLEDNFMPLPFGKRTSQLYIDPLTAKKFRDAFPAIERNPNPFGIFQLIASTPDMATLTARRREMEDYLDLAYELEGELYASIPYYEDSRFQGFLGQVKTAKVLLDWINEVSEARIYETYSIDPGDLYRILELADWLMYSLIELYRLFEPKEEVLQYLRDLHLRLRHGVREELLELVKLPNIGRKRARALYNAGFRSQEDITRAKVKDLLEVEGIGIKVVEGLFRYFGVEMPGEIKGATKRSGRKKRGTLDAFLK